MTSQQEITPESQQIERYQQLIERQRKVSNSKIVIETQLKNAEQELEQTAALAEQRFQTRDINALKEVYRERFQKNDLILAKAEQEMGDAEAIIQQILKDMDATK